MGQMKRFSAPKIRQIAAGVVVLALLVGLALDLHFHGLVWRFFYNVTGEEAPASQLYGFVQYLTNVTRRQPSLAIPAEKPPTWDQYTGGNPLGVNTFLDQEVEPAKREQQLQMISAAGIGWIRQPFNWQDLEIRRGSYIDDRNGAPVDAWIKYDNITDLAEKYHVNIIARLGTPPAWSEPPGAKEGFAPPTDYNDFVAYATALAARYKGRIHVFQVWNEPNVYPEWGDNPVDPEAYTDLLCRTYTALKAADPANIVISGALAPTVELSAANLNDLVFLQRMYDAHAANCFDILGVQGYGLFSGPTDQRMRPTTINFSHLLWLRDMMVANGDAAKPIWIGEMAWNPVPNAQSVPNIAGRLNYGQVTDQQAADYAVQAYQRAKTEWPFVGVMSYWFFKLPDTHEQDQSPYYFRMVDPDFTPRPVYNAIKDYGSQPH
jgi:polysaccharide biosynthesis protein PslG